MSAQTIQESLNYFNITPKDLQDRVLLRDNLSTLSSVLVDTFAKEYLITNEDLASYLLHTDSARLIKNIKEFIVFIFTQDVDKLYIQRIHQIGAIHYSIKLNPQKVSYGFMAIKEVLNKMCDVNEELKVHRFLISKILSFVEYHMNNSYYLEKQRQSTVTKNENSTLDTQMQLFSALDIHKKYILEVEANKITLPTAHECKFGKILHDIQENSSALNELFDIKKVDMLHKKFHTQASHLKNALLEENQAYIDSSRESMTSISKEMTQILSSALNSSLNSAQMALSCATSAIQKTTELFFKKDYKNENYENLQDEVKQSLEFALSSSFSWVIDSMYVLGEVPSKTNNYDVNKLIRYKGENFFIAINLTQKLKNNYIIETISLLVEVVSLHLASKERELSLITFADKAQSANKAKDMFLANMSHELRTPLNAIKGFSQILLSKNDTPDSSKKFIEKINIAGNHLLELVNTILDFAKLESGKMQFKPHLQDIASTLQEVATLVSPLAQEKNITLSLPKIISLNMYIDTGLFKQVLINLLSNAIKFTPDGGRVSLKIQYESATKCYRFEVKDTGIGLTPEEIQQLFIAFSQIENSYQKDQQGTGLGLMISKTIIEELHKGKIWVESVKGEGSNFIFSLPTPNIEANTFEIDKAGANSKHLLIVEDSPSYQQILIEHLQNTHRLTFTDSVNKAKKLLTRHQYDFIILDFFLIDGISSEILEFMEDEEIETSTIVISAEDEITILSSLSGFSNLDGIINKDNIDAICNSIKQVKKP